MSFNLFDRLVQVQIGDDNTDNSAPPLIRKNTTVLSIPTDPRVEKLKINFSVTLTQGGNLTGENYIEIYNLKDSTQSFIKDRGATLYFPLNS